jgi:glucosamine--fructose-6-phosphate aminotransferase (isomerizing)
MSGPVILEEIAEQPAVVERLLAAAAGPVAAVADRVRADAPTQVVIAARGSSDNAARYAQHLLGRLCGLPVALASPSLITLYGTPPRLDGALVLGISQSGASPDIHAVLADARRQGSPTAAITNDPGSLLAGAADHVIELGAGVERSLAATKTYTASLAAVAALAVAIRGEPAPAAALRAVPAAMARQLERALPDEIPDWETCTVVGRGPHLATAFEAALKLKELTGTIAEPFSSPDLLHGPIAAVGPQHPLLAMATSGPALAGTLEVVRTGRERGAPVLAITDRPAETAAAGAGALEVEAVPDWLSPLIAILPVQRLAVAIAQARGIDVDRPFSLSKITRTT